jgi:hypothetical protein
MSMERLTIEDRTSEEHQKFDEEVLLLGGDLVEAEAPATLLDLLVGETLLDVGFEPLVWHDASVLVSGLGRCARPPELRKVSVRV